MARYSDMIKALLDTDAKLISEMQELLSTHNDVLHDNKIILFSEFFAPFNYIMGDAYPRLALSIGIILDQRKARFNLICRTKDGGLTGIDILDLNPIQKAQLCEQLSASTTVCTNLSQLREIFEAKRRNNSYISKLIERVDKGELMAS